MASLTPNFFQIETLDYLIKLPGYMTDAKKKSRKAPKLDQEGKEDKNEDDDISQYIRKIQLQSVVLKKLSDNLEQIIVKEKEKRQPKS
jgi:hypothetical protein